MMNYKYISLFSITAMLVLFSGCKEVPPVEELVCESTEDISYQEQITPILEASCNIDGCHSAGFVSGDFTDYDGVLDKVNDGSLFLRLEDGSMPPITPLSSEQLQLIVCWISNGHQNN
jgi:hypothetical protein